MSRKHVSAEDERQRLIYANMPLYCSFWNDNFEKIDCSPGAVRFFGLKDKQEYLDRSFELSPEYQPDGSPSTEKAFRMLKIAFDSGYNKFEWMHRKLDGEPIPTEITFVRIELDDGHKAVVGYTRDLREIKAAEAKALDTEKYRKLMLDAMPLYCIIWDDGLNFVDCNSVTLRLFGLDNHQNFLKRFFEFSPKSQPCGKPSERKMNEMLKVALAKGHCVFEWMHEKPFGNHPIPYEITLVRIESNHHKIIIWFGKNLSEIKAAEAEIKETTKRMEIMFNAMPFGCSLWDENLNMIDCNEGNINLFGVENKQHFIDNFFDLSPKYQPDGSLSTERFYILLNQAFELGRIVIEWVHQNANGEPIPVEVTLVRVNYDTGFAVIAYLHDLRELKDKTIKLNMAEELAFKDPLTGVHNRRYFMQFAEKEFDLCNDGASHVGVIMLDVDYFKQINDTHGHNIGDEALKLITNAAQSVLRETDLFARYGGEEFIVLVPRLNLDNLVKLAWRICKKVEATNFIHEDTKIPITISAGVTVRNNTSHSLDELIKRADFALYRAKLNGRNRVEVYTG